MEKNNLQFAREEIGMTQVELGYIFGVSGKTVSGWENFNDSIPIIKLVKFSDLYGFSLDFLTGLDRENKKYPKIGKLDKKKIGNRLKKLRKQLGLTQSKIAEECMISQTTYSNYENGLYLINTITLYTICKNHKISIDEILR